MQTYCLKKIPLPFILLLTHSNFLDCMRRKWAGINDDGGLAKITKIDEENETYDVKYILDNRKVKGIDFEYVKKHKEDMNDNSGRGRRGSRNRVKKEKITISKDGLKEQIESFIINIKDKIVSVKKRVILKSEETNGRKLSGTAGDTNVAEISESSSSDSIDKLSSTAKTLCQVCAIGEAAIITFRREAITIVNCSQEDVAQKRLEVLVKDFSSIIAGDYFDSILEKKAANQEVVDQQPNSNSTSDDTQSRTVDMQSGHGLADVLRKDVANKTEELIGAKKTPVSKMTSLERQDDDTADGKLKKMVFSTPAPTSKKVVDDEQTSKGVDVEHNADGISISDEKLHTMQSEARTPSSSSMSIAEDTNASVPNADTKEDPTVSGASKDIKPSGMKLSEILPPSWSTFLGLSSSSK